MSAMEGRSLDSRIVWNADSEARKRAWHRECDEADGKHLTSPDWTLTSEGKIPHWTKGSMRYPVRLIRLRMPSGGHVLLTNLDGLPTPERDSYGRLVYTFPGDK